MADPTRVNPQVTDLVAPATAEKPAETVHGPGEEGSGAAENAAESSEG